ncbi:MAG TPA: Asp-tRNA(Asn)/Glu-tRNA(Gln) amidotransferase subunit GatC, partial [Candidatus Manganitrophaceae bacterium]|nr:Asp-tRNA(Asn)/Glu-tRNA(Gln) amidotransferase subunit GatC [Candidatus Manganitrophaceae bacterium]
MKISQEQVKRVAKLARLSLTPEETERFSEQLSHILSYIEKLNQLDTSKVEPTSHVLPLSNVFREDQARPSLPAEEALANAPDREGPFFRTPKII